jgi:hypothetical protein
MRLTEHDGGMIFVNPLNIDWIIVDGNYTQIKINSGFIYVQESYEEVVKMMEKLFSRSYMFPRLSEENDDAI